jgi:hypothetical protein
MDSGDSDQAVALLHQAVAQDVTGHSRAAPRIPSASSTWSTSPRRPPRSARAGRGCSPGSVSRPTRRCSRGEAAAEGPT